MMSVLPTLPHGDPLQTPFDPSFPPPSLPLEMDTVSSSEGTALKGLAVVCYHLALLELARREQTYFPLMLVIDSPAVGDMNEVSYNNLLLQ